VQGNGAQHHAELEYFRKPFEFLSLGLMAYVGSDQAVTQVEAGKASFSLAGYLSFLLWRSVYITKQVPTLPPSLHGDHRLVLTSLITSFLQPLARHVTLWTLSRSLERSLLPVLGICLRHLLQFEPHLLGADPICYYRTRECRMGIKVKT
jgi:hypothetical protein